MKIQLVSDLHLEFPENRKWLKQNPLIPKGDILLMAGDVVTDKKKKKARFFYDQITKDFSFIISAMGNHEFYSGTIDYAYPKYKSNIAKNFIRLNNHSYVIEDVKIIVSTLWGFVPDDNIVTVSRYLNDYHKIWHENDYPLNVGDTNTYHKISVGYITEELKKPFAGKIVIMTHHMPSLKCLTNRPPREDLNGAYASNLDNLILSNPNIVYWFTGHSHDFNITTIGNTQIIRNPMGYVCDNQQEDFRRDFVVEL